MLTLISGCPARGVPVIVFDGPSAKVTGLAFAPDGRLLAVASKGVAVWDLPGGRQLSRARGPTGRPKPATPQRMTFLPDGQLAAVVADGAIVLSDPIDPARTLLQLDGGGPVTAAAFAPSGRAVVLAGPRLRLVALDGGEPVWAVTPPRGREFGGVAVAPDGGRLAVAANASGPARDHELRLLEPETGRTGSVLAAGPGRVDHLAWSPRGDRIAGLIGLRLWLWDAGTGNPTGPLTAGGTGLFTPPAFHPSGRWVLAGGANVDGGVYVWDAATGRELRGHLWPVGPVHAVAVSPDGVLAAAGGERGRVAVWDVDL